MKRYNYDGDPDANGDFYLVRDVGALEDEVDAARRELARMRAELAGSEASRLAMDQELRDTKSKHFGFVDPHEARGYLHGRTREIVVSRAQEKGRVMRVGFPVGPRYYKLPGGVLPKPGWDVYVGSERARVVEQALKGELVVEFADGRREQTINWRIGK